MSIIDAGGRSVPVPADGGGSFGFPTWSPDGTRVAAARSTDAGVSVVVIDAERVAAGERIQPKVVFQKAGVEPFYLFWSPDGSEISFLASEDTDLKLRIAPADGSAPLDGSGRGAVVRSGNPFYYDWLADDRLLAHIGTGADGFLGQLGLDGKAGAPIDGTPADFRSAVVSHDHRSIAFVRATQGVDNEVIVTALDGSHEEHLTAVGPTAIAFDPAGDTLGAIGAEDASTLASFPLGPLRLMDRGGKQRTLVDGLIVAFWWSPDGKTVAAVRVLQGQPAPSAAPFGPSPTPTPTEIHLVFADVATGKVRSEPIIHPAPGFVNGILAYFDQYALSHRMWAPDGSSILMPEVDESGLPHLSVRFVDGRDPVTLAGAIGFWSP
jgi:TolB protein